MSPVSAQTNNRFTAYTVNDGLPQSSIDEIAQDKNGFLWIGTAGGLCRFDGYSFRTYRPSAKAGGSINADKGFRFFMDKRGQFWVITYNGLSIYDPHTDRFTSLLSYTNGNIITILSSFLGEDGRFVYAGLCNYGIVQIDKQTHRITRLDVPGANTLIGPTSWYRGFIDNDKLWIAANKSFVIYDIKAHTSQQLDMPLNFVINMNGGYALGINDSGAVLINKTAKTYTVYTMAENGAGANLTTILRLSDTLAILGSGTTGLYYFNIETRKVTRHIGTTGGEKPHALSAACLYNDHSGNLWIGTSGEGVYKMEYPFKKFKLYRSSAAANNVNSIYADSRHVYIGNSGNGFDVFSRNNGFEQNVPVKKQISSVGNSVNVMAPFGSDKILMTSFGSVLHSNSRPYIFSIRTGQMQLLNGNAQKAYAACWGLGNLRQFIFNSAPNSVLTNVGEYLLELTGNKYQIFSATVVHRFNGQTLSCCFRDNAGNLWIGTYKGAFVCINEKWQPITLPKSTEIKTINQDNAGNIWLGTNNGIYTLNNKRQVANYYTEENRLLNEHIYGILKDDDGNMWFSHNKGLTVYNVKKNTFRHFGADDGLQSAEFNSGAYFKATDGELFFGGINGTTSFRPREILSNPYCPVPNITNILLFDKPYATGDAYWESRPLTFPYVDNSLSFEFSLPEYTNPAKNEYAYMLEGVDKTWINSGNKRFARYPGLRPGNYTFKVKAANNDGLWGASRNIVIQIIPPFWQRSWFVFLEIVTGICIVALSVSMFQKAAYKKKLRALELQQKIQSERERISRDLHDNIGTHLSLINKSINEVTHPLNAITDDEKNKRLYSAQQGSVEVIDVLRETIWALNKPEITLEEFADNLKTFVQKKSMHLSDISIKFDEQEENRSVILSSSEALNLFRICQEAVTNTIKYAFASHLKITITAVNGKYRVSIAENGKGFDPDSVDKHSHYGIGNMRYRANEILCDFTIDSKEDAGTAINIIKR